MCLQYLLKLNIISSAIFAICKKKQTQQQQSNISDDIIKFPINRSNYCCHKVAIMPGAANNLRQAVMLLTSLLTF